MATFELADINVAHQSCGPNLPGNSALLGDSRGCLPRVWDTFFVKMRLNSLGLLVIDMDDITLYNSGVTEAPASKNLAGDSTNWKITSNDERGAPHSCLVYRGTGLAVEIASPLMIADIASGTIEASLITATRPLSAGQEVLEVIAKTLLECYTVQLRRKAETCSYQCGSLITYPGEVDIYGHRAVSNSVSQLGWQRDFGCCVLFPAGGNNTKTLNLLLTCNPDVVGGQCQIYVDPQVYAAAYLAAAASEATPSVAAFLSADGAALTTNCDLSLTLAIRAAVIGFFDPTIANPGLCGPEAITEAQIEAYLKRTGR